MVNFKLNKPPHRQVEIAEETLTLDDFLDVSGLKKLFKEETKCSLNLISCENSNLDGKLGLVIKPDERVRFNVNNLPEYLRGMVPVGKDYLVHCGKEFIVYIQNPRE